MLNFNNDTESEIINCLINDKIGRRSKLINFIKLISSIQNNEIIAINGAWGSGKTFFIKQFELLVNFINNYDEKGKIINPELNTNRLSCLENLNEEQINKVNDILKSESYNLRENFDGNQTNCLYFNAWEYDNNNEPILSIIYKIINDFPYLSEQINDENFKLITGLIDTISLTLSNGNIKASDYINSKKLIEAINTSEEIKIKVNEVFNKLLEENSNKMIIVIDELDRCRPMYAIKLLEEIKHYIKNKDIIVILTTNITQLSNTIKNIYGYKFNVDEYLDKIIDLTISLDPIDKIKYIKGLPLESSNRSSNWFTSVLVSYSNYKKLEMRSINRFVTLMKFYENYIYLKNSRGRHLEFLLEYIFLPYCLGEQLFDSDNYSKFIRGIGYEEFYQYISSSDKLINIIDSTLYPSIVKEKRDYKRDIKVIYDAIYNQDKEYFDIKVGNLEIDNNDIRFFYDLCTMLSDFTIE